MPPNSDCTMGFWRSKMAGEGLSPLGFSSWIPLLDSSPGFLSWIPILDSSPGFLSWLPLLASLTFWFWASFSSVPPPFSHGASPPGDPLALAGPASLLHFVMGPRHLETLWHLAGTASLLHFVMGLGRLETLWHLRVQRPSSILSWGLAVEVNYFR